MPTSTSFMPTSQVYQRWRDLLLNCPLVWAASLDLGDRKAWIEVVLARAGNAPLNLVLPLVSRFLCCIDQKSRLECRLEIRDLQRWYVSSPYDDVFDFALSLLPRCRQITMSVGVKHHLEAIVNKAAFSAIPHLQELSLYMPSPKHGICILMDSDIAVSLGSNPPQIKLLDIDGFWTNFSSPIFQSLTKLHVANPPDDKALTAYEWLEVLRRLPQLEELDLNSCFANGISTPDTTSPENLSCPIFLARLQLLVLKGICTPCHEILSQLQFPASCAITIDYDIDTNNTVDSYSAIMSELCKKIRSPVQFQKITGLSLELSCRKFLVTNMRHLGLDDKAFFIALDMDNHDAKMLLELVTDLLRIISSDVDDLYYRFSGFEEFPEMATIMLEPFRQVRILRLDRTDGLFTIASIRQEDGFASNPLILPGLSNIYFYMVKCNAPDAAEVSFQEIVDLLHHRSQINAPIGHVLLKNCYGSEKETLATKLRDMGVEVEIDDGKMKFPIY